MTPRLRAELEGRSVEVYLKDVPALDGVDGMVRVAHSLGLLLGSRDGAEQAFIPWSAVGVVRIMQCWKP